MDTIHANQTMAPTGRTRNRLVPTVLLWRCFDRCDSTKHFQAAWAVK